jgi:hypothetical protein
VRNGAELLHLVELRGVPGQAVKEEVPKLPQAPVLTHNICICNNVDEQELAKSVDKKAITCETRFKELYKQII